MSSHLVAIRDHYSIDEYGTPLVIHAGKTYFSSDCSMLKDPTIRACFAAEGSHAAKSALRTLSRPTPTSTLATRSQSSRPTVAPKPSPNAEPQPKEHVELRLKATPTITIAMRESVWDNLRRFAQDTRDGRETGGFFFGERLTTYSTVSPNSVTSMVERRSRSSASFDLMACIQEKASHAIWAPHIEEQGCWHTHPYPDYEDKHLIGQPSPQDMRTWLSAHDFLQRPYYVGLILTAEDYGNQRWSRPNLSAWIVRRDRYFEKPVCEPAQYGHLRRVSGLSV